MPIWENFQGIVVPLKPLSRARRRLSLTSDIMSYRRCARQYGHFGSDGFVPAQATQIFYGTIIHQVLDMCHRHWRGLMNSPKGSLPADLDVENYFDQVQNALKFRGIRAVSGTAGARALHLLKRFNALEGPNLYDRVCDTEYRLETDRRDYILRGVVDVLARSAGAPEDASQMEIWDYKGTRNPGLFSDEMKNYRWQMLVYAELYKRRSGVYPAKAILYFLAEIVDVDPGNPRPANALIEIKIIPKDVEVALAEFDKTARDIIAAEQSENWPLPPVEPPENTCAICDIRWSCDLYNPQHKIRLPFDN